MSWEEKYGGRTVGLCQPEGGTVLSHNPQCQAGSLVLAWSWAFRCSWWGGDESIAVTLLLPHGLNPPESWPRLLGGARWLQGPGKRGLRHHAAAGRQGRMAPWSSSMASGTGHGKPALGLINCSPLKWTQRCVSLNTAVASSPGCCTPAWGGGCQKKGCPCTGGGRVGLVSKSLPREFEKQISALRP